MYATIWIPQLSLQSVLRSEAFPGNACIAILRETTHRSIIFEVNSIAARFGVKPGQTVSQAIAKCSQLLVRPQKPLAEKAAQHILFQCMYSTTPELEESTRGTYTIDLKGIPLNQQHLQINQLLLRLKKHGFFPKIGVGQTPDLSFYAAKCAEPVLWIDDPQQMFPKIGIETAVTDESLQLTLKQWGIHTLADFAKLSKQAIGQRLGNAGLKVWDSLHNRQPRLLNIKAPPSTYQSSMELEFEIETLEPLLFVIKRLIDQLWLQLKNDFLKAQVLILQLSFLDKTNYKRVFKLPEPTLNKTKIEQVLHTHLENLETQSAIESVQIDVIPTESPDHQPQLFQLQVKDPWQFSLTQNQLVGLVGSENVGSPLLCNTHEPDRFTIAALPKQLEVLPEVNGSSNSIPSKQNTPQNPCKALPPLPLQRFRPPLPAVVTMKHSELISLYVKSPSYRDVYSGKIESTRGPWHLSGMWWDNRHWIRMEWDIKLSSGPLLRLLWYQRKWFVEGAYG